MQDESGQMKNKYFILTIGLYVVWLILAVSLTGCSYVPKNWYDVTLETYREGFAEHWRGGDAGLNISDEKKDPDNEFGYLLRDLDGDGAPEVLVGLIDDSAETKFTDIVIWHRDLGARQVFSTGEGYYIYLCDNNVIRMDSWYGSETRTQYMVYDSSDNAFPIVDGGSRPLKVELTSFTE